ncbi:hypothetical protein [Hyphomonas sp. ND6WE1B]|uniref:hypothetical protein n=1 Tax=Hyphomonas sp. ND6WE1B TaxID=1848191 RepID=UPI0008076D5E|nr:hypothetical protein [Hyphomonas sp. ND6WE1B]
MTIEQTTLVAQIVGVIAVAATLIYLDLQVQQGAQQMQSESQQAQFTYDQTGVYKFVDFPELGRIFSQTEPPSFEENTKLFFWMIGQMRAREYEWRQYQNGAITKEPWDTYRGVIYFVLGTERGTALWLVCQGYFNPGSVEILAGMMKDALPTDLWDQLQAIQ